MSKSKNKNKKTPEYYNSKIDGWPNRATALVHKAISDGGCLQQQWEETLARSRDPHVLCPCLKGLLFTSVCQVSNPDTPLLAPLCQSLALAALDTVAWGEIINLSIDAHIGLDPKGKKPS